MLKLYTLQELLYFVVNPGIVKCFDFITVYYGLMGYNCVDVF